MTSSEHSSSASSSNPGEIDFSGCVFVIDDDANVRKMLALALETAGFDVLEVSTEIELQRHLAHIRPDALVIDVQRAESDGLHLLKRMRTRSTLAEVPIVFLANSDANDFEHHVLGAGADSFGLRPIGMLDLQNRVGELVSRRRRNAQQARSTKPRVIPLTRTG